MNTPMPATLDEAMAVFQAQLPSITKDEKATVKSDKGQYSYGYAGLDTVSEKVLRALGALGVSWRTRPTLDDSGRFVLAYRLRHINGDEETGVWPLVGGTPQQMGSAITYARRYALMAVTGVFPGDEDDDGAAAAQAPAQRDTWESARPARQPHPAPSDQDGQPAVGGEAAQRDPARGKMFALLAEADLKDRDAALQFINEAITPAHVESTKELTRTQVAKVINRLERYLWQSTPPGVPESDHGPDPMPGAEQVFEQFLTQIKAAPDAAAVANVSKLAGEARGRRITQIHFDRLSRAAAHRLGELEQQAVPA